jgi:hypothetical protein
MAGINSKKSIYAISRAPQASFAYPLPPTSSPKNYDWVFRTNIPPAELVVNTADNSAYTTGTPQATERSVTTMDIAPVFENERMNVDNLGRRAYAAFGDYAVTTLDTGVYQHTFGTLNVFNVNSLPAYTIVEKVGEPTLEADEIHNYTIPSNTVESFNLRSGDDPYVVATTNWRGSGKRQSPSSVNFGALAVRQEEKVTLTGTVTTAGNITAIITIAGMTGSPITLTVAVLVGETASDVAFKIRTALNGNANFSAVAEAYGQGADIYVRKLTGGANDATMNLEIADPGSGAQVGIAEVATSTTVTAGAASASHVRTAQELAYSNFKSTSALLKLYNDQSFSGSPVEVQCAFRSHNFTLNNNLNLEIGYGGCPVFYTDGNPDSGGIRSEIPTGGQSVDVSYVIQVSPAVAQNFDPQRKLETQAYFSSELSYLGAQIGSTNYFRRATFRYERQTVQASPMADNGGLLEYQISAPPLAFGTESVVELVIISDVADYSTAT